MSEATQAAGQTAGADERLRKVRPAYGAVPSYMLYPLPGDAYAEAIKSFRTIRSARPSLPNLKVVRAF